MKIKTKIWAVLLPIITIFIIFIYGYLSYINTTKYQIKQNEQLVKPDIKQVLVNLKELEQKMNSNKSFIASTLGISIANTNEVPININSGASIADIYTEYNNLKIELTNKYKSEEMIKNLANAVSTFNKGRLVDKEVIIYIVKYIALNELKILINIGSPYLNQVNLISTFNDKWLLSTMEDIKKEPIPSNDKIISEYLKLSDTIDYELYLAKDSPSFVGKAIFKTKKYVGIKKEGESYPGNNIRDLIKQRNFAEIYNLLKAYRLNDSEVIKFFNNLERKVLVDNAIQENNNNIVSSVALLTNPKV